jgi:hypothetical protein
MWPCRHLPRFSTAAFVALILHGMLLYFARSLFPFETLFIILIAASIESIVLSVVILQMLGPGSIGMLTSARIRSRDINARNREAHTANTNLLLIPKPWSILTWIVIVMSVIGISSFKFTDFENRNFAYYLGRIGNYASYASPVMAILFVVYLWHAYRKGFPIAKTAWLQLGVLLLLTLSLAVVIFGP